MSSNFNREIKILTDFNLHLEMFNLSNEFIIQLKKKFPCIKIEFINFKKNQKKIRCRNLLGNKNKRQNFK